MEIETNPVTLEQRIDYLKQAATNADLNRKSFPWATVVISVVAGAGICFGIIFLRKKQKGRQENH